MHLPDNLIRHRWVRVTKDPKGKRVGRSSMIIDKCYEQDGSIHSVNVAYVADHPFLKVLNQIPHAPRSVKALYRKENRLKHKMSGECWAYLHDWRLAEKAWADFLCNRGSAHQ